MIKERTEINMPKHFGLTLREKSDGLKLTRDNYIRVSNKSSIVKRKAYSESEINNRIEYSLYNFDLNIEYFRLLSKQEFNKELLNFINKNQVFKEITDLSPFVEVPGYYLMILDEYSQSYIGASCNIRKRIQSHWSKQKEFDRLVFGSKENSILSIDSFRAFDTTRIFVFPTNEIEKHEDYFISQFNYRYLLNRTKGGKLKGLSEAIINRKTRDLLNFTEYQWKK